MPAESTLAYVESVKRRGADVTIYLAHIAGPSIRWLNLANAPRRIDAIVGVRLEIYDDEVRVAGLPWARRVRRELVLLRKKPLHQAPADSE